MLMRFSLAVSAIVLAGSPSFAQNEPAAPAPVPEKKICRSVVPTGSIMGKRICLTKTEWKQLNDVNSRAVDTLSNRGPQQCGAPGGPLACGSN